VLSISSIPFRFDSAACLFSALLYSHFIVYGGNTPVINATECSSGATAIEQVFGWAPGELPFVLPSNMGFPLGAANQGFRSFSMQIHYDNPELLKDIVDNSGVRIYFVNESRPIQVGMFEVGDPFVFLENQPVGGGVQEHTFECSSGCSALALPETGVTVLRSNLHVYKTGIQATSELIRNGTIVNKATVEFFDFAQQGGQLVQAEPFTILPGDSFRARCYYRNSLSNSTIFGLASSNEMCIASMLYYPRQTIEAFGYQFPWTCAYQYVDPCSAEYSSRTLNDVGERLAARSLKSIRSCNKQIHPAHLTILSNAPLSHRRHPRMKPGTVPMPDSLWWASVVLACVAAGLS
jgi:Copper type II ascorbate-dependent monooxygenase, C-terminal domain/Copper type II ascorbate-dependent monooxygenase, N-terminal domain